MSVPEHHLIHLDVPRADYAPCWSALKGGKLFTTDKARLWTMRSPSTKG